MAHTQGAEARKVHEWTGPLGDRFRDVEEPGGTYYREGMPRALVAALERARLAGSRVRIFYGDRATGRDWMEENDVTGTLGRTRGPVKVPLLVHNARARGGDVVLLDSIVRLMVNGREAWRADTYRAPVLSVRDDGPSVLPFLPFQVYDDGGTVRARFWNEKAARRWVAFMLGERATK